jgi:hypothetical protein
MRIANSPDVFARALGRALEDTAPYTKHPVGADARILLLCSRMLPQAGMYHMSRLAMGLPKQGAIRDGTASLTLGQRAMIRAAATLPPPVMARIALLVMKFGPKPKPDTTEHESGRNA